VGSQSLTAVTDKIRAMAPKKKDLTLREHLTRIAPLGAAALTQEERAKGGRRGGAARAEALSPAQRRAIAKKAAQARWAGKKQAVKEAAPKKKRPG
jgi:hypothetical protein